MIKKFLSAIITFSLILSAFSLMPQKASAGSLSDIFPFVIMATANIRGQLEPISSGPSRGEGGMTKVASVVEQIRQETYDRDGFSMLIDVGSTIRGTGITNHFARRPLPGQPHPSIALMNHMKYDVAGYSSLDFSTTPQFRDARVRESDFTWVSSNAYERGNPYAADHRMLIYDVPDSAHVLRIGILSIPDPGRVTAIPSESIPGIEFYDPMEEIMRMGDILQVIDRADFLVLMTDMVWEQDEEKRKDTLLYRMIKESRVDIAIVASDEVIPGEQVLFGEGLDLKDVLVTSPGSFGRGVSRIELTLERCKCPVRPYQTTYKENGARMINGKVVKVGRAIEEHPTAANILNNYTNAVERDFGEVVGFAQETFSSAGAVFRPTSLSNLGLQTMQRTAQAPIAFIKPNDMIQNLNKGPITVGDINNSFVMDDTIYSIQRSGAQIKSMLEEMSDYIKAGQYDYAVNTIGLSYAMDLRQPRGSRILNLSHAGSPVVATNQYKIAVLSSLLKGPNRPPSLDLVTIQENTRRSLREEIVEHFRSQNEVAPVTAGQWIMVPDYLDHWAHEAVAFLQEKQVISGYTDGRFLPNRTISRAEYATIVTRAYNIPEVRPATPSYTDVEPTDWFFGIVEAAKAKGMLPFVEGSHFFPDRPINREEAMIMLVVAVRDNPDAPTLTDEQLEAFKQANTDSGTISPLAMPYLAYAQLEGLIQGYPDNTIRPKGSITRAETATIVFRAHYPVIMIAATGNVASSIFPGYTDPYEDRPIGGLGMIDAYMNRYARTNPNFIALDAGNYLMGSAVSYLTNGTAVGDFYSQIGYHAMGLSNQDFFYGVEPLLNVQGAGNIPMLSADLSPFDENDHFYRQFGNLKVGVAAVSGFSIEDPYLQDDVREYIEVHDAIAKANESVRTMIQEGASVQVLMTGIEGEVNLMGEISEELKTFLDGLNPKPSLIVALNKLHGFTLEYEGMMIVAPGAFGNSIGTGRFIVNSVTREIERIDLNKSFTYADELDISEDLINTFERYENEFKAELDLVVGQSENGLFHTGGGESPMGNLIADVMRYTHEDADFGFILSSMIQTEFPAGDLKARHVFDALPIDDDLVVIDLNGYQLRMALEHGVTFTFGMIQISGMRFEYNNLRFLYDRVTEIDKLNTDEPYDNDRDYRIVITETMRRGLDAYTWFLNGTIVEYPGITARQALFDYIETQTAQGNSIDRDVEGRIYMADI